MTRVACIGEAMIELTWTRPGGQIGFSGDVLNTAVYLGRAARNVAVDFISVLGRDGVSDAMVDFIETEGVGTAGIERHPERLPGVYAITTDEQGERSFSYWRDKSAARTLFENGFAALQGYDLIYLSGITLAILPPNIRNALIGHLADHPARIAFDSNYRPRLWEDAATARQTIEAMWRITDVALPSEDDECLLFGDADTTSVLERLRFWGAERGALKRGGMGPTALDRTVAELHLPAAERVVDTTAAGDSFNGGYLAAILSQRSEESAMSYGHRLATAVIGHPGAIIPAEFCPEL